MVMFKILDKPPKTIFAHFKDLKYFYKKYFPINPGKFEHVAYDIFDDLAKPHALKIKKTSSNPFITILFIFEV